MKAGRIKKRRRIRKEQPLALPTDLADIQAGTEGPQVVAAPELSRVCQTVGPGNAPCQQKATKCNIQVNVSRSTERTTIGRKERRKRRHTQQNDKQSGLINCSREGRKAEKHHEQELVRKNSNEQQAQVMPTNNDALSQGSTSAGKKSPARLQFVWWRLIFVGPQYGSWFMSPFTASRIWRRLLNFWKFIHLCD